MLTLSSFFMAVASLLVAASAVEAAPINKCVVNGAVTYQQGPCPSSQARKEPTLEELNAGKKKRRVAAPSPREPEFDSSRQFSSQVFNEINDL